MLKLSAVHDLLRALSICSVWSSSWRWLASDENPATAAVAFKRRGLPNVFSHLTQSLKSDDEWRGHTSVRGKYWLPKYIYLWEWMLNTADKEMAKETLIKAINTDTDEDFICLKFTFRPDFPKTMEVTVVRLLTLDIIWLQSLIFYHY